MIWPIALIVFSNIFYQIAAKSVPKDMNALASLSITYLVAAVCSTILFFVTSGEKNIIAEFKKVNFAPVLLGVVVVGLEFGFIYAYKNGWQVSTTSIVQSSFLAIALIATGALLYHEAITASKVIGMGICLVGLFFISRG